MTIAELLDLLDGAGIIYVDEDAAIEELARAGLTLNSTISEENPQCD